MQSPAPDPWTQDPATREALFAQEVLDRVSSDLGELLELRFEVGPARVRRVGTRLAGQGQVHVSFRLALSDSRGSAFGALLLPLPAAVTLARHLLLSDAEEEETELDRWTKAAILEVGRLLAGAVDDVVRRYAPRWCTRFAGCQGVRPGVRPAFPYREGDLLIAAVATASLGGAAPFEIALLLPLLDA